MNSGICNIYGFIKKLYSKSKISMYLRLPCPCMLWDNLIMKIKTPRGTRGSEDPMAGKKNRGSGFDRLVSDLMSSGAEDELLEDCMSREMEKMSRVPPRYRLIALGFVKRLTLEELNRLLKDNGFAELYSRNFHEAGLIFAFQNRMSYEEWKDLAASITDIRESAGVENRFFSGGSITMEDLRGYIESNATEESILFSTKHLTRMMSEKISEISSDRGKFREFLEANVRSFSTVREKTRFYFCKYLYFFLAARIDRYISALVRGYGLDTAVDDLSVFKSISRLKRKKMEPDEARQLLITSPLSCGELFDSLNYFFFGYLSLDWMDIQLEYYGDIGSLPAPQQKKLASALRRYNKELESLDDRAVIAKEMEILEQIEREQDELYSGKNAGKSYQLGRAGENSIRKIIRGELDPDRTTLTAFLLFFGSEKQLPEEMRITQTRLDRILSECGFSPLREEDDFDYFIIRYLKSDDPAICLTEEADRCALGGENFYLYRMYRGSGSAEAEWMKLFAK